MQTVTDTPTPAPSATADLRLAALEQQLAGLAAQLQLAEERALALEARVEELRRARIFADAYTASIADWEASDHGRGGVHLRLVLGGAS